SCIFRGNGNRSFWPKNIFYKESRLTHHRPPSRFIPTDRSIFKPNLKLAIIIVVNRNILSESSANRRNRDWFRSRHLAHHINVMYPTIHDGTQTFHEIAMDIPHIALTLLIEIHPHDEWFS